MITVFYNTIIRLYLPYCCIHTTGVSAFSVLYIIFLFITQKLGILLLLVARKTVTRRHNVSQVRLTYNLR